MPQAIIIIVLFAIGMTLAQAQPQAEQEGAGAGAYLNTHFEAQEQLARAAQLTELGQWSAAARAYETAGTRFGAYLVAKQPGRFICVRDYVNERLCDWPPEGLMIYRETFEQPARMAMEAAQRETDVESLVHVANRYFPTRTGALALELAAQRELERGHFRTSQRWYERLAAQHPDRNESTVILDARNVHIPCALAWRAKAVFCAAVLGQTQPLDELLDELESTRSDARVTWGGREQSLSDWLVQARVATKQLVESRTAPQCPAGMFAGGAERAGRYASKAKSDARLWKYWDVSRSQWDAELSGYESAIARKDAWLRMVQGGRMLAAVPVADCTRDGRPWVYIHDGRSVWAVDPLRTDRPAWQYELAGAPAALSSWTSEDEPPPQHTCLVKDGHVLAHLDREQPPTSTGQTLVSSVLVCLDAATGSPRWESDLATVATAFEEARLDGAPLLHEGRLYAVVRKRKPFGFEACLLLRIDPVNGHVLWSTHLGESATGSYGYRRPTLSHASASGDLVFVQTNLGTVSAVSAQDGNVLWLRTYDSKFSDASDGFWPSRLGRPIRSWQYTSPLVWRDAVVCMPLDSESLHVFGQFDGTERFTVSLEKLGNPEQLIGLRDDVIYLAGSQVLCYDLSTRGIVWQRPVESGQLFGRGALSDDSLWLPTTTALLRYRVSGGPVESQPWTPEEAGNVLPLADQLVIASAKGLYGLAGKQEAFAQLEGRLKLSKSDPAAALALAELAFNIGEDARGLTAAREAVDRMGGFARITDETDRRRLFNALTAFANAALSRVHGEQGPGSPAEAAITLHRMAGQCAPDLTAQVEFRFGLARAYSAAGTPRQVVIVYQQILSDDALRNAKVRLLPEWAPVGFPKVGAVESDDIFPAGNIVEQWINRLVTLHGRSIYEPIESQAQSRLKLAATDSDPQSLLKVAQMFPNSDAARRARLTHAQKMEGQKDWFAALRSYRAVLWSTSQAERPELIRLYTRCLVQAGQHALADQWLRRGVRDFPSYRFNDSGSDISFKEYRSRLLSGSDHSPFPATNWSWWEAYRRVYPDRVVVLEPPQQSTSPSFLRDCLFTYSASLLEARSPATGRALWPKPIAVSNLPLLLSADAARCYLATNHQLLAIKRSDGQQSWSIGQEPAADPMGDPESTASWIATTITGTSVFVLSDAGGLTGIELSDGAVRWTNRLETSANHQLVADLRHVCYATWLGRKHVLYVLDARSGELRHTIRPLDDWPIQRLVMAPDGNVLLIFSNAIQAVSVDTGETRWRAVGTDRYVAATVHVDTEGLVISPDGRRLCKYDIDTGRAHWMTEPVATGPAEGLWTRAYDGAIYAICGETLAAYDLGDGRILWQRRLPDGLRAETPRFTPDSLVVVSAEKQLPDAKRSAPSRDEATRYHVTRYALADGRECAVTQSGPLITEPLTLFGGLYVFDNGLLIVDGSRLIGYAAAKE